MQRQDLADADMRALAGVLAATTMLLERLSSARTPAERAAAGADFDATVMRLKDDLVGRPGYTESAADGCLARALARAAEQVARVS
jgi:hypothetical protein